MQENFITVFGFVWHCLLSGCVYHNYGSPHINGVITDQGQTLAGVKVSLANFDQKYRQPPPIPRDISRLFRKASGMFLFPLVHKIAWITGQSLLNKARWRSPDISVLTWVVPSRGIHIVIILRWFAMCLCQEKILATRIIILYAGRILIANNFALGAFLTDWSF